MVMVGGCKDATRETSKTINSLEHTHKLAKIRKEAMRSNGVKSSATRQDKLINKILALKTYKMVQGRHCRLGTLTTLSLFSFISVRKVLLPHSRDKD